MSRTLEVYEHATLHVSEGKDGITQAELNALVRFNDAQDRRFFDVGHRRIKLKSFVGCLEVGALSIQILPKADRGATSSTQVWRAGLVEMLRVALGLRLEHVPTASQQLARFRLLDLLALGYLAELEPLMHHGLSKGYRSVEANGAVFRGRLKITDHIRDNAARADRFFVEYQTYDHDITVNRLLATALHALERCSLSPHVASRVKASAARFPEVRDPGQTRELFDRVRLTRSTQRYQTALVYARMVLEDQGPQLRAGTQRVFALLFDMNVLWERYVAALFRRAAVPGLVVTTQERPLFWQPAGHDGRRVRPDIVVRLAPQGEAPGKTLLVLDTKWKTPSQARPSDDDLKQMFVYNELLEGARSVLLYPATAKSIGVRGTYARRAHSCEQMYLGLLDTKGWSTAAMHAQIQTLLEDACGAARS